MGNSGTATYYSKQINFGYLKLISELPKLILGSGNSGLDSSGLRNGESPSLVLVINNTKLLMPYVKCFELGISNTCDEGVCGKECGHKITKKWCMDMK
jgi:hypothetical protein